MYNKMSRLSILNQKPFDIGVKRYYESQYKHLLNQASASANPLMDQLSSKINQIIRESKFM